MSAPLGPSGVPDRDTPLTGISSRLSPYALRILAGAGITTVGGLMDDDTCLMLHGIGVRTMRQIVHTRRALRQAGYKPG